MTKNVFNAAAVSVKNVNVNVYVQECQNGVSDIIEVNGFKYENNRIETLIPINVIDINYDINKFSTETNMYGDVKRICGSFTYKFDKVPEALANIISKDTVYTGTVYYFEDDYNSILEDLEEWSDDSRYNLCKIVLLTNIEIIEKNDAFTRTVKLECSNEMSNIINRID